MTERPGAGGASGRSVPVLAVLGLIALAGIVGLTSLGIWQVERRAWKLELIAQVEGRLHAAPVAAPGPAEWPGIGPSDSYRRIAVRGSFLNDRETLVQAVTELGPGFWVITPLRTDSGFTLLVNRGFVPADRREPSSRAEGLLKGPVEVVGLLRLTEPGGGFLRSNDPAAGRWFSRDVSEIARAVDVSDVAPYFLDADARANPGGFPVGGLTVVAFPNNHLVYALTWFGLALMLLAATIYVARHEWRLRHPSPGKSASG